MKHDLTIYYELMFKLIENTEAQIKNGLFVVKHGVDIICVTNFNDNEFPITILHQNIHLLHLLLMVYQYLNLLPIQNHLLHI